MRCGWCKQTGLSLVRSSGDELDWILQPHKVMGTVGMVCKGPESYRSLDPMGKPGRVKAS